ncbi:MAG: M23 family metallopeptidase [Candidatus Hydrogenedentes bacterium]|nr:M23 family metallopeptidase [Candidatus Hydrogenedentota bacterium]
MKKWTVMLIPHDRGNTRSLHVYSFQVWFVVCALTGLSFTTAFLYQRHVVIAREASALKQTNRLLVQVKDKTSAPAGLSDQERADIERQIRAEYEARDAAITSELTDLYDVEAQLRKINVLPPRANSIVAGSLATKNSASKDAEGGKGGPAGGALSGYVLTNDALYRPPHLIYGMRRPTADMIIQEIKMRKYSLADLLTSVLAQRDQLARMPALWPSLSPDRRLSSGFGFRRDPFNSAISHHDGADVSAAYGSPVIATGKGRVLFAGWDGEYGNLVRIAHSDGIETWYGHMSELVVSAGDAIEKGQIIGKVGSTGRSTGAHIHYEVRIKGTPVDPVPYLIGR